MKFFMVILGVLNLTSLYSQKLPMRLESKYKEILGDYENIQNAYLNYYAQEEIEKKPKGLSLTDIGHTKYFSQTLRDFVNIESYEEMTFFSNEEKKVFKNVLQKKIIFNKAQSQLNSYVEIKNLPVTTMVHFDLKNFKLFNSDKINSFCKELPKGAMLHIHPWGTVNANTVKEILQKINPIINFEDFFEKLSNTKNPTGYLYEFELETLEIIRNYVEAIESKGAFNDLTNDLQNKYVRLFILPKKTNPFGRFMALFKLFSLSGFYQNNNIEIAEPIMWVHFLRRAAEHNVDYIEVTTSFFQNSEEDIRKTLKSQKRWVELALSGTDPKTKISYPGIKNINLRFLAGLLRNQQDLNQNYGISKKILKIEKVYKKLKKPFYLRGFNLQATETKNPALEKGQVIYLPWLLDKETELKATIHAGELAPDVANIRNSLLLLGVNRIGHGIYFNKDPFILYWAAQKQIPLEISPSSNLRLGVIKRMLNHPLLEYLRMGLKVSLSTDDEGTFKTTISNECTEVIKHTDVTYAELKSMSYNGIQTSFAQRNLQNNLNIILDHKFKIFEKKWAKEFHF